MSTSYRSTLRSYYRQISPHAAGSGAISGYLSESSLHLIFTTMDRLLKEKKLEWKKQVFVDLGSGEGYPFFYALLERECQHVIGVDIQQLPLISSWNAAKHYYSKQVTQRATWCFCDLDYLTHLDGPSIVYTFNFSFGTTTLHLLELIERSLTIELVFMTERGLREALKTILKKAPCQHLLIDQTEHTLYTKWQLLLDQAIQKGRRLQTRMVHQSTPFLWFTREDWTETKTVSAFSDKLFIDLDLEWGYAWEVETKESTLCQRIQQVELKYFQDQKKEEIHTKELQKHFREQNSSGKKRKRPHLIPFPVISAKADKQGDKPAEQLVDLKTVLEFLRSKKLKASSVERHGYFLKLLVEKHVSVDTVLSLQKENMDTFIIQKICLDSSENALRLYRSTCKHVQNCYKK